MLETAFIVDSDPRCRATLAALLRSAHIKAEAFADASAFLLALDDRDPGGAGCLVLDAGMPAPGGLRLQQSLIERGSELPVIFVAHAADTRTVVQAMRAGALTFLAKPIDEQELVDAVHEALNRPRHQVHPICQHMLETRRALLSPRQRDVFDHLVHGLQTKEVARRLRLSPRTVEVHRAQILERLGAPSITHMIAAMLEPAIDTPNGQRAHAAPDLRVSTNHYQ